MQQAIVPLNPAVFSAWGLLNADYREDVVRSFVAPLAEVSAADLQAQFEQLEAEAKAWLEANTVGGHGLSLERFADMRYLGQEHTIRVPVAEGDVDDPSLAGLRQRFDRHYEQAYAHALPDHELEFVVLRLVASGKIDRPPMSRLAPGGTAPAASGQREIYMADLKETRACSFYPREQLAPGSAIAGPAIIEEWSTTILLLPGQALQVDDFGNLRMTRST